jgi:cyclopropane fatty-acyl-phospholipid synthase-like methyltransferase
MQNPYDAIADEWYALDRGFRAKAYVDTILARLEPGARVLDLGCGTGVPITRYVAERGFRVTGIDSSERLLEIARRAVPEAEFGHAEMLEVRMAQRVGAVIAWDSVFHTDRRRHAEVFAVMRSLLEEGGWLLMSAGGSSEEGFESEMFGQRFYYSGYEPAQTVQLLTAAGFDVELCEVDDSSSRGHVAIIARAVARGAELAVAPDAAPT